MYRVVCVQAAITREHSEDVIHTMSDKLREVSLDENFRGHSVCVGDICLPSFHEIFIVENKPEVIYFHTKFSNQSFISFNEIE